MHCFPKRHDQFRATERSIFSKNRKMAIFYDPGQCGSEDGDFKPKSTCELAESPRKNCNSKYHTEKSHSTRWKVRQAQGLKVKGMQKWMGWSIIRAKMCESLGTKTHQGSTWLNVKCVFVKNLKKKKKSHTLCVPRLIEVETIPQLDWLSSLFLLLFLYFSCVSFFSEPSTNH